MSGLASAKRPSGGYVSKAGRDVVGYLLAVPSVADHEHRRRPYVPEGAEQFVVAYMVKVQVCQVQGREFAYQVPVLSAHTCGIALADSTQWHGRGEADAHPVLPDFIGQGLCDLDYEPRPVLY